MSASSPPPPVLLLLFLRLLVASSSETICAQCSLPERMSEEIAVGCCLTQASLQTAARTMVEMCPFALTFTD